MAVGDWHSTCKSDSWTRIPRPHATDTAPAGDDRAGRTEPRDRDSREKVTRSRPSGPMHRKGSSPHADLSRVSPFWQPTPATSRAMPVCRPEPNLVSRRSREPQEGILPFHNRRVGAQVPLHELHRPLTRGQVLDQAAQCRMVKQANLCGGGRGRGPSMNLTRRDDELVNGSRKNPEFGPFPTLQAASPSPAAV